MPTISANFAISADGKSSTRGRHGAGFGSAVDHSRLLELRAAADAVLVGRATLEADTMSLALGDRADLVAARLKDGRSPYPARVIACGKRRPPPEHPVFHHPGGSIHLLDGHETVTGLLDLASELGWRHIHCEGGPRLFTALMESDLIDTLYLTICPRLFGSFSAPSLLAGDANWAHSRAWSLASMDSVAGELFLCYQRA